MSIPWNGEKRPRSWAFLGLAILALGPALTATGCGESSQARPSATTASQETKDDEAEDAIAVEVGDVRRDSMSSLYSTSATLRADKQATVTARGTGVIRKLLVEEGDWVEAGQKLAVLEDDEQRIAFAQAQAAYDNQDREHQRAQELHAQSLLSEEEYDTARREATDAKHAADLAELALSRTVIRATFAGRVLTRYLDVGATVNDGTPVYDIADLDPLYADVQIPERQVSQLQAGQRVRLLSDDDTSEGEAEIERIAPVVDPTTGTVKVTLTVKRAGGLRPGSFVRVGIVTDTHGDTLVVPRSALVAEGRRWHLFRLTEDDESKVELIEITRGFEEGDRVEILTSVDAERPLSVGDPVVVTGASSLSNESAVQIMTDTAEETDDGANEEDEESSHADSNLNRDEAPGVAA